LGIGRAPVRRLFLSGFAALVLQFAAVEADGLMVDGTLLSKISLKKQI
jgi:hypothetical protein